MLAVLLTLAVAVVSPGLLPRLSGRTPGLSAATVLGYAISALLALAAVGLVLMSHDAWGHRARGTRVRRRLQRQSLDLRPLLLLFLFLLPIALAVALVLLFGHPGNPRGVPLPQTDSPPSPVARGGSSGGDSPVHWVVVALLAGASIAAWLLLLARQQRRRKPPEHETEDDGLVAAVDESLEALEREADARLAVLKAYARMEGALAAQGAPRGLAETPLEYLVRALAAVRASGSSIRQLTRLFERAKFSQHPIDAQMKGEAIAALRALRAELARPGGVAE